MYDVNLVLSKMKKIVGVESNSEFAKLFNLSYNTLNTWLKRKKFPQEFILEFAKKYNVSLDYLLKNNIDKNKEISIKYYGFKDNYKKELILKKDLFFDGAYYLLRKDNIYTIVNAKFNIFENLVHLKNEIINKTISFEEFKKLTKGLIINY